MSKPFTIAELTEILAERDELETPYQRRVMATLLFLLEGQREQAEILVAHGHEIGDRDGRAS